MFIGVWSVFGAIFGALIAQRKGWNVLAGAVGGLLLGPLALLLLFVSGSGGEATARSGAAQAGRGLLIGVGIVVLALAALIVYLRITMPARS